MQTSPPSEYALFVGATRALAAHTEALDAARLAEEVVASARQVVDAKRATREQFAAACADVISGTATVAWDDAAIPTGGGRGAFVVRWPATDGAPAKTPLVIPRPPDSPREDPPKNAAHVGSSVQGKAGS